MDEEKKCATTKKTITKKILKANISKGRIRHSKKRKGYQEQLDRIIEGYAQEIKELRKKRDQSMEKSNQETNDDQPELEEILEVSNNKDQEYTGHVDTKNDERKKARKREANDYLVAAKWKNRMIGTGCQIPQTCSTRAVSYTHLDVYKRQQSYRAPMSGYIYCCRLKF